MLKDLDEIIKSVVSGRKADGNQTVDFHPIVETNGTPKVVLFYFKVR